MCAARHGASLTGAFLTVLVAACGDIVGAGVVEVRLENGSSSTFIEATLYTSDGPITFGNVGPGTATPYIEVSSAYRIATTQVVIEEDTLRLQVIDFVGEEPLSAGRYTYVLNVYGLGSEHPSLTQEFRQDG